MAFSALQNVSVPGTTGAQPAGATAQGAPAPQGSPPGGNMMLILPIIMLVVFMFLNMRRQKKDQEARGKLKKGDRVVTSGGLIGELVELEDRVAKVKIAPGTTVQVLASTLSQWDATPAATKTEKELADLKDAKAATADKK